MADELRDVLVKVIPFLLVMWMLTGAIYPAIDMTAGEKERGTMETLLISPAERTEIVLGKFLAVDVPRVRHGHVERAADGGGGGGRAGVLRRHPLLSLPGLAACVLAALPLAMLFAAVCLTLGVFARSTKEGNYYMVPMFFVVLPLAYWSMTPGMELDAFTSWVPVANALLLQQRLMAVRTGPVPVAARAGGGRLAGGVHRGWRCGRRCGSSTARACCSARRRRAAAEVVAVRRRSDESATSADAPGLPPRAKNDSPLRGSGYNHVFAPEGRYFRSPGREPRVASAGVVNAWQRPC